MDNEEFKRLVASIGLASFVNYYGEYKKMYSKGDKLSNEERRIFAQSLLDENKEVDSLQA